MFIYGRRGGLGHHAQAATLLWPTAKSRRFKRRTQQPLPHVTSHWSAWLHHQHAERTAALWDRVQASLHVGALPGWGSDTDSSRNTAPGSSGSTPAGVGARSNGSGASVLLVPVLRLDGCGWSCDCAPAWLWSCRKGRCMLQFGLKLHGLYLHFRISQPNVDNRATMSNGRSCIERPGTTVHVVLVQRAC
jgi:hypothetical protein